MQAVYYRAADGSEPVNDFIDSLTVPRQVVLDNQIDRLNMLTAANPHLPFPHSSQVEGELRELRCHYGRELYRVLYRRSAISSSCYTPFRRALGQCQKRISRLRATAGQISKSEWTRQGADLLVQRDAMPPRWLKRVVRGLITFGKLPRSRDTSEGLMKR
jgi:phage-related protein